MSIYASMGAPTDEHLLTCAKWVQEKVPGALVTTLTTEGAFELDDSQPCTCGLVDTPIKFIHSGHYPDPDKDGREGYLDIACIPGHVSRPEDGIEPTNDDDEDLPPHPYLRFGVNGERVVLDEHCVDIILHSLNHWKESRRS